MTQKLNTVDVALALFGLVIFLIVVIIAASIRVDGLLETIDEETQFAREEKQRANEANQKANEHYSMFLDQWNFSLKEKKRADTLCVEKKKLQEILLKAKVRVPPGVALKEENPCHY